MPGDAFFHTVLTEQTVKSLESEQHPLFQYEYPVTKTVGYGCGFAGYDTLQFKNMSDVFKKNIRQVYYDLRKIYPKQVEITDETKWVEQDGEEVAVPTGKKIEREINGFSLLFYSESFDRNRHHIGVKYNERWVEETVQFGHSKDHVRLEDLVGNAHAVMVDWRDGPLVEPLQAIVPPIPAHLRGGVVSTPVQLQGKIRAIILWDANFEAVFRRASGEIFFEVSEDGLREFRVVKGQWSSTDDEFLNSP